MDSGTLIIQVALAWSVAVTVKALVALQRGTPYVMAAWDGGILRVGVRLGRGRTIIKLVATASMAILAVLLLTGVIPRELWWLLFGILAVELISDFTASRHSSD